MTPSIPERTL